MVNFEILGRKVDLKKEHLKFYVCYLIAVLVVSSIVTAITAYLLTGSLFTTDFFIASSFILNIIKPIGNIFNQSGLLDALLIVLFAKVWSIKKDLNFARAITTSNFLVFITLAVLNIILTLNIVPTHYYNYFATLGTVNFLFSIISSFASIVLGSVQLYLSLLLFIEWDKNKLKKMLIPALAFGILSFLMTLILPFLLSYNEGYPFTLDPTLSLVSIFASFLFGLVIFYSIKEKTIESKLQYLFAGFYVSSSLFYQLALNSDMIVVINLGLLNPIITLILLYAIDKSSFFDSFGSKPQEKV